MTNLVENLTRAAREHPDQPAVREGATALTYAELDRDASAAAARLVARGVRPGDRVAVVLPNVLAFPVVYHAVLRAGAVVVPLNPLFRPREVRYHLTDSRAVLAIGTADDTRRGALEVGCPFVDVADLLDPASAGGTDSGSTPGRVVPREDSDTAVVLYTSGTTGTPKGAELTHANLATNAATTRDTLTHTGPGDAIVGCLPLFHVFGMTCALNAAVASACLLTLVPRFSPRAVADAVRADRANVFVGVPTMYVAMLGADLDPEALASLRTCISGGSSLPREVMRGFEGRFECAILEGYGLSETSPVVTFNHPERPRRVGSIGTPVRGVRTRVVDADGVPVAVGEVGELQVQGEGVMKGYLDRPDATRAAFVDGWFRTGDLARCDEDGYVYLVDRAGDLVIRGGYNVYPREVEEVLYEHPDVVEAAVVGVQDDYYGQEVCAHVVLRPGAEPDADALRAFARERLAPYKYPRVVRFREALPKGPSGKILKREL